MANHKEVQWWQKIPELRRDIAVYDAARAEFQTRIPEIEEKVRQFTAENEHGWQARFYTHREWGIIEGTPDLVKRMENVRQVQSPASLDLTHIAKRRAAREAIRNEIDAFTRFVDALVREFDFRAGPTFGREREDAVESYFIYPDLVKRRKSYSE